MKMYSVVVKGNRFCMMTFSTRDEATKFIEICDATDSWTIEEVEVEEQRRSMTQYEYCEWAVRDWEEDDSDEES